MLTGERRTVAIQRAEVSKFCRISSLLTNTLYRREAKRIQSVTLVRAPEFSTSPAHSTQTLAVERADDWDGDEMESLATVQVLLPIGDGPLNLPMTGRYHGRVRGREGGSRFLSRRGREDKGRTGRVGRRAGDGEREVGGRGGASAGSDGGRTGGRHWKEDSWKQLPPAIVTIRRPKNANFGR
eukprot:755161-Hanusia_phi.AAC.3